jgi:hypothetical protein
MTFFAVFSRVLVQYQFPLIHQLSLPPEALYGYAPRHFGITANQSSIVPSLDQRLKDRRLMTDLIKQHPNCANTRMKNQADKGRTPHF